MKAVLLIWNIVLTVALVASFFLIYSQEDESGPQIKVNREAIQVNLEALQVNREAIRVNTETMNEILTFINATRAQTSVNREAINEIIDFIQ